MGKNKEKKGCCLFTIIKWFFIAIAVIAVLSIFSGESNTQGVVPEQTVAHENTAASSVSENQTPASTAEATVTPVPTAEATVTPTSTPEPSTREEWVLEAAKSVYKDSLISVGWEQVDGQKDMIVIWCKFEDNLTNNLRRTMFMGNAKNMFSRIAQLGADGRIDYGSCYIVGRTAYLDQYGNEFDGNAMEIRLKAQDLEKINWTNITHDMLQNLATTYAVHPLFR